MTALQRYWPEYALLAMVGIVSLLGFWDIYFGPGAQPQPRHHAHLFTTFGWIVLVAVQLSIIVQKRPALHRKVGNAIFGFAPLLVATTAALTVISAARGLASGQGDFLIVQNVMATLGLAVVILAAFLFKRRRELHGTMLMSSLVFFGGIATFFVLIGFVPQYRIEGPETFYRFAMAGETAKYLWFGIGLLLFLTKPRVRWPYLIVGLIFFLNDGVSLLLTEAGLITPLTVFVGSLSVWGTFLVVFVAMLACLAAIIKPGRKR